MQIKLIDDAKNDLFKGSAFYEAQNEKLGDYFFDSIISDIESLQIYCAIHIKINGYHRLLSKRFPYAIYYKVEKELIIVYAILDCRSNPRVVKDRLK